MKMKHHLCHTDYPIWQVIQNGNGLVSVTTNTNGMIKMLPPKTAEEVVARERERKAKTTFLMTLPEDHLAKFHKMVDAKEMWEAIKSRFGGNDESKKTHKYLLKQQFEGFFINDDDLEKMDLKWQVTMISIRIKKFHKRTGSDNDVQTCSKTCAESYARLKKLYDEQRDKLGDASVEITAYTLALKKTSADESDSKPVEHASSDSDFSVEPTTSMLALVDNVPKVVSEPKLWTDAPIIEEYESDSDDDLVFNVQENIEKLSFAFTDFGKHVKSPRENVKETGTPNHYPKIKKQDRHSHTRKGLGYARKSCFVCGSFSHLIRDCNFHEKRMAKQAALIKSKEKGNKAHLTDYQEFKGGYVASRGSNGRIIGKEKIKAGRLDFEDVYYVEELKHYNLFSMSQMCDKKNKVLFTDTDCLVLSPDFKLPDENQALIHESNKWHKRLGHVNLKNLNKLVKRDLVRDLPSKIFENDHTCVACQKEKQHKASSQKTKKKANDEARNEATHEAQDVNTNNTNLLNDVSTPVSVVGPSKALNDVELLYPDDPSMPHLKDIYASLSVVPNSKVWVLVDLPFGKKAIETKWVYMNKKDESEVVVRNKARLVAQGHRQDERIDYDEVFAPVARIEAIRIFLTFASYMGFIVYQIDVKSAFLYETIDEEVYVTQPPGFVDPKFPNWVYKVVKALYGLHQAPRACVKTSSTPIETQKPLVKDEEAADVDVHLYRTMSSPNHPTFDIKDAFSFNFLDYFPATLGHTYPDSSNDLTKYLLATLVFSPLHYDPYIKVMQAYDATNELNILSLQAPIASPTVMPPVLSLFDS
uniref:Copia protein n=1 Tax=Tanacetum cinerariifolium TaxID=118510 RepID=A0A6L2LS35_TANCI|nr:copia protein [Tanacetum cinerariifolium]